MKIPANTLLNNDGYTFSRRCMTAPQGMEMEDLSIPGNWAHVFSKVKVKDEVVVFAEDMSWRLELLVVETGPGWVKTRLLHAMDLTDSAPKKQPVEQPSDIPADAPQPPEGYTVSFAPAHKWRAMTSDPQLVVSKDHKTRADAVKAAHEHAAKAQGLAA